jgi:hypothetical protein
MSACPPGSRASSFPLPSTFLAQIVCRSCGVLKATRFPSGDQIGYMPIFPKVSRVIAPRSVLKIQTSSSWARPPPMLTAIDLPSGENRGKW